MKIRKSVLTVIILVASIIAIIGTGMVMESVEDNKIENAKEESIPATVQVEEEVDPNSELKDYDRNMENNFNSYMKALSDLQPLLNVSIEAGREEEILAWVKEVDAVLLDMMEKSSALVVDNPPSERQDKAAYAQAIDTYTALFAINYKDFMTTGDPEYRKSAFEFIEASIEPVGLLRERIDYDKEAHY